MTDLGALCRACGMCCDGSLFGRGTLERDEVAAAKKNRLLVVNDEGSFEQPCTALAGGACSIYDERPRTCRRFVCRLYERLRTEGGDLETYLARVRLVRELFAHLERTDVAPPELAALLDDDFARA